MIKNSVENAIQAFSKGRFVIVIDDQARENEADLVLAAEKAAPEQIAFMIRHTSGILCVPLLEERLNALALPQMVPDNQEKHKTAFTVSVDAASGISTGISAADRWMTIQTLVHPDSSPQDLVRPGHLFPLRAEEMGVLQRPGHTEAAIDLASLAGMFPAGVISELMHDDGTLMRNESVMAFSKKYAIPILSINDLCHYRKQTETLITKISTASLETEFGSMRADVYRSQIDQLEHLAIVNGTVINQTDVLVRIHSECLTGDVLASKRCDCGFQLRSSLRAIEKEGRGVVIYLRGHEGRGIGLGHKIQAYHLQQLGRDTVEANEELGFAPDLRDYFIAAQVLKELGIDSIRLLTNNPNKIKQIQDLGIQVNERVPLIAESRDENRFYLQTKKEKLGHLI